MDEFLEYSNEALEVKADFYNKSFSVYVEGEEDVLFWDSIFKIAGFESIHIEDVGGYAELIPHMEKIVSYNTKIIVAADLDHYELIGFDFSHERIIRTYGYSIENTLYNTERIQSIIKKLSYGKFPTIQDIENWKLNFGLSTEGLLIFSIANSLFNKGIEVFGDKCNRFLKTSRSHELCSNKIADFNASREIHFETFQLNVAKELVENATKDKWYLVKGHFLTNGIINLIKYWVKFLRGSDVSISLQNLYALCIDLTELKDLNHPEYQTVIEKTQIAVLNL